MERRYVFHTVGHEATEFESKVCVGDKRMTMVIRIRNHGGEDKPTRELESLKPKEGESTMLWNHLTKEEKQRVKASQLSYFQIHPVTTNKQ